MSVIERLIPAKETLTVEFKSNLKKYNGAGPLEDTVDFAKRMTRRLPAFTKNIHIQ